MIKEHDRIVLRTDLPDEGLKAGDVGTVVHIYKDGGAYEVEFVSLEGRTLAVATLKVEQVRPVNPREITHARERSRRIDQLIYQIYGLTDDEIKVVEEATR